MVVYKKIPALLAATVLPPPPAPFTDTLPPRTDPLSQKLLRDMSDEEMDLVIRNAANKVNEFWASVFLAHGRPYAPAPVVIFSSTKKSKDYGSEFLMQKRIVRIDRTQLKKYLWSTSASPTINLTVAHEIGHYVAIITGLEKKAFKDAVTISSLPYRREKKFRQYNLLVYFEQQADFFAGVAMKRAGLLHSGDPEEAYYVAASLGDDVGYLRFTGTSVKKDFDFSHGRGAERAALLYEGMQTGDVEKALEYLGPKPDWSALAPKKKQKRK